MAGGKRLTDAEFADSLINARKKGKKLTDEETKALIKIRKQKNADLTRKRTGKAPLTEKQTRALGKKQREDREFDAFVNKFEKENKRKAPK